jgi:endogenous inhibitor of DNA gyrase (YacG/DUF329 family)
MPGRGTRLPAGISLTCFTSCLPGACFTSCLPGSFLQRQRPPASRAPPARPAAMRNRARQTCALLQSGTSCRSKPATYPRRPGRSRTAWTIPTVPCPSCQTASRRYAHSHRHPTIKQLLCRARPLDLHALADGLGWRPPPRNPPDGPSALRYSPAETIKMANRHPSTHSATSTPARLLSSPLVPSRSGPPAGRRVSSTTRPDRVLPPNPCSPAHGRW